MKSKNFKILILPSGAATGIVTSTILSHLERDTGIPVYKHFDEIWCSSIGSVIAALLTTPNTATEPQKSASEFSHRSPPMSADEVSRFLEHSFSNLAQAISIRRRVKKYLPASILMRDTLIPLRILTAEVTQSSWVWPLETRLKTFSSEGNGATSLGSVVASSCTVFPLHPRAEPVQDFSELPKSFDSTESTELTAKLVYCIDAGCEVCTESCMNPLVQHFLEFSKNMNPAQDRVTLYFISNGWVRLDPACDTDFKLTRESKRLREDGQEIDVRLFNVDVKLGSVIQGWQKSTRFGRFLRGCKNEQLLYNLAGVGLIPTSLLKAEATKTLEDSEAYKAMLQSLSIGHFSPKT